MPKPGLPSLRLWCSVGADSFASLRPPPGNQQFCRLLRCFRFVYSTECSRCLNPQGEALREHFLRRGKDQSASGSAASSTVISRRATPAELSNRMLSAPDPRLFFFLHLIDHSTFNFFFTAPVELVIYLGQAQAWGGLMQPNRTIHAPADATMADVLALVSAVCEEGFYRFLSAFCAFLPHSYDLHAPSPSAGPARVWYFRQLCQLLHGSHGDGFPRRQSRASH